MLNSRFPVTISSDGTYSDMIGLIWLTSVHFYLAYSDKALIMIGEWGLLGSIPNYQVFTLVRLDCNLWHIQNWFWSKKISCRYHDNLLKVWKTLKVTKLAENITFFIHVAVIITWIFRKYYFRYILIHLLFFKEWRISVAWW